MNELIMWCKWRNSLSSIHISLSLPRSILWRKEQRNERVCKMSGLLNASCKSIDFEFASTWDCIILMKVFVQVKMYFGCYKKTLMKWKCLWSEAASLLEIMCMIKILLISCSFFLKICKRSFCLLRYVLWT